jgi:hypothetical protein
MRIRIRIKQLKLVRIHADPDTDTDPQPWLQKSRTKFFFTSSFLFLLDPGSRMEENQGSGIITEGQAIELPAVESIDCRY